MMFVFMFYIWLVPNEYLSDENMVDSPHLDWILPVCKIGLYELSNINATKVAQIFP